MTPSEKTEKKRLIGEVLEVGSSRLKDNEVEFLYQFVTQYDRFIGITETIRRCHDSWSSDGKFTRWEYYTYSLGRNDVGICVEESYHDDEGKSGEYPKVIIYKARDVINWFRDYKRQKSFDSVRDICNLI
ncbi:Hypothetical protein Tpal_1078 [Trichococcus palustris]|uniref:Uncharacterized protein n=1 Tax=Trichococcus palustris TaxID=140314 RepID=A0A143YES0_9LACT|nr:hypothetical protein [Trichococcus palustris]CZQ88996.1 Hypothetical protein Tpal_1078 [Trichococcus palustris]SFL00317.1 hypothetical protein SAMN04488076_11317 [Trichococcus palustris]